jgi:hypothetical protein
MPHFWPKNPANWNSSSHWGHILSARYQRSRLSGVWAKRVDTPLRSDRKRSGPKKTAPDPAALLHLAQQMHFFRDSRKCEQKKR